MTTLRINTSFPRILFERGYDGSIVAPEKAKTICVCVRNELITADGLIAFHAIVKVPKREFSDEKAAQSASIAWLLQELPNQMTSRTYWDFFRLVELDLKNSSELPQIDAYKQSSLEIIPQPALLTRVAEDLSHIRAVQDRFKEAKGKLWHFATTNWPLGFAQTRGEAHTLLRFIEGVLASGADEGGYESYKARSAMSDYDELARRKDANNHNYKSTLESFKRFAYCVSFPSTWHEKPRA